MIDYISREEALMAVTRAKLPDTTQDGVPIANGKRSVTDCVRRIKGIPAADVQPVRHGVNIEQEYDPVDRFRCSECGIILEGYSEVRIDEDDGDETNHEFLMRFCPNCGAKMEVDDGTA